MNIHQVLGNLGLSEAETNLYLSALQVGEAPLSAIARRAGVKRGSAYLVASTLTKKGLMGSFKTRDGLKFVAMSPKVLKDFAKKRLEAIEKAMPELQAMELVDTDKPQVTMYSGREGFLSVFEESLNIPGETIRAIGSLEKFYETITYEYDNDYYIPKRVEKNITFRGLYYESEVKEKFPEERNRRELREARYLPDTSFHPCFTFIYRNTVVIFSSKKELVAVKIVSCDIFKSEKAKFDIIWEGARK